MKPEKQPKLKSALSLLVGRMPPADPEAEAGIVAGLMHFPDMRDEILSLVSPDDFTSPAIAATFEACRDLIRMQAPLEPWSVVDRLRAMGRLEDAGGVAAVSEIWMQEVLGTSGSWYANAVLCRSMQRQVVDACVFIMSKALDTPWTEVRHVLNEAEERIAAIAVRGTAIQQPLSCATVADEFFDSLKDRIIEPLRFCGFRTGWPSLDGILGGIRRGNLAVLAARSSVGKSAAALNMAQAFADAGLRVLFCSLETTRGECMARMLAATSKTPLRHILEPEGRLTEAEIDRLYESSGRLDTTIWIDDTEALSVEALRRKAGHMKARGGLDAVFVDCLQLMTAPHGVPASREEERLSAISRMLKAMAKELQVAIVALAQIFSTLEGTHGSRPNLSDLRNAGSIGQDADVVVLMSRQFPATDRPSLEEPEIPDTPVVFDVAKNRQGSTGSTILLYRRLWAKFMDCDLHVA